MMNWQFLSVIHNENIDNEIYSISSVLFIMVKSRQINPCLTTDFIYNIDHNTRLFKENPPRAVLL